MDTPITAVRAYTDEAVGVFERIGLRRLSTRRRERRWEYEVPVGDEEALIALTQDEHLPPSAWAFVGDVRA